MPDTLSTPTPETTATDRPPIQTAWPGQCFGCSRHNPQGLQLQFVPTATGCRTRCTVPDHLCGFDGIAHGGITSLLLDEVAAWAMAVQLERLGLTAELTAQYHQPVPTGTDLVVEGALVSHDATKAVVRSTVHSAAGPLLAEAKSTWVLTTLSRFAEIMDVPVATLEQFFGALQAELQRHRSDDNR